MPCYSKFFLSKSKRPFPSDFRFTIIARTAEVFSVIAAIAKHDWKWPGHPWVRARNLLRRYSSRAIKSAHRFQRTVKEARKGWFLAPVFNEGGLFRRGLSPRTSFLITQPASNRARPSPFIFVPVSIQFPILPVGPGPPFQARGLINCSSVSAATRYAPPARSGKDFHRWKSRSLWVHYAVKVASATRVYVTVNGSGNRWILEFAGKS